MIDKRKQNKGGKRRVGEIEYNELLDLWPFAKIAIGHVLFQTDISGVINSTRERDKQCVHDQLVEIERE